RTCGPGCLTHTTRRKEPEMPAPCPRAAKSSAMRAQSSVGPSTINRMTSRSLIASLSNRTASASSDDRMRVNLNMQDLAGCKGNASILTHSAQRQQVGLLVANWLAAGANLLAEWVANCP